MEKARWKHPLMNFESRSPQAHTKCKELAQKLFELIPELFSKTEDWTKIQQCKQRPDESIQIIMRDLKKTFKQYSGLMPESFSSPQNDLVLNSTFLEGLDEDLATLVKRHNLGWSGLYTSGLVTLADQLFKTIRKKKDYLPKS